VNVVLPCRNEDGIVLKDEDETNQTIDLIESDNLKETLARSESVIEDLRLKLNRMVDQNDWYLEQNARYKSGACNSV
jgi:hypothetical protein